MRDAVVRLGASQREPDLIHTPIATERIYSMRSVSTIRPFGNTVRRRFRSVVIVISSPFDCSSNLLTSGTMRPSPRSDDAAFFGAIPLSLQIISLARRTISL